MLDADVHIRTVYTTISMLIPVQEKLVLRVLSLRVFEKVSNVCTYAGRFSDFELANIYTNPHPSHLAETRRGHSTASVSAWHHPPP